MPVLRGTALRITDRRAFLWTKGFIPRLRTYPGWEVPNPLVVDVNKGNADLRTVMEDVMCLTKVNFNSCVFSDGLPVTLKFADAVGEILVLQHPEAERKWIPPQRVVRADDPAVPAEPVAGRFGGRAEEREQRERHDGRAAGAQQVGAHDHARAEQRGPRASSRLLGSAACSAGVTADDWR